MKRRNLTHGKKTGSALVITLLGIVLLTIIVVSFMQTMSLALTTSKSYADVRRATFAAQAGLDTAIAQITLVTATNFAFVTGVTNYPSANFPLTVIGQGNLTNFDQMMPLISGQISCLTNFGSPGSFSNNFYAYVSPRSDGNPADNIDVNSAYTYSGANDVIQETSDANMYRAPWVVMTNNVAGSPVSYTRYAYIVLDDSARLNPTLMTGTGTGYANPTNWYTGPQDISVTYLTNTSGAQVLSASQLTQIAAASSSIQYSDASLDEVLTNRANYEAVRNYFTSQTNPSFDIIPAWYPNGGMPKYNINDLATNTAYGATPLARSQNIASIITNNLPNFYLRDAALSTVGTNNTPGTVDKTLYITRLAANIVDYISPDGTWGTTDYSTNMSGVSPQGHGVYPVLIYEMSWVISGAGTSATKYTTSTFANQFWLSVWNPYTTPVTINSASIHISDRPAYWLGTNADVTATPDYTNSVSIISGHFGSGPPPVVVGPNEFVVMGFVPQTNTITGLNTSSGPESVNADGPYDLNTNGVPLDHGPLEQYALTINGQTTGQSGALNPAHTPNISGGLQHEAQGLSTNYAWEADGITIWGSEVADPRFESYYNQAWNNTHDVGTGYTGGSSYWKGADVVGGSKSWGLYIFPPNFPLPLYTNFPVSTWANRDNIARCPASVGSLPPDGQTTPDKLTSMYNQSTDSNAAPEVIRNGPMVSIGELGHISDPAYANDILNDVAPREDCGGFSNAYSSGGGRSLRIGRSEANGTNFTPGQAYSSGNWDVSGERAISLLDLFTINNGNRNGAGVTNTTAQSLMYGGAPGRININTASSNVLAAAFYPVQTTSDPGLGAAALTNVPGLVANVMANRPYSSLSDLYKIMPVFDTNTIYSPNFPMTTAENGFNWGNGATILSYYPSTLNVFNRVHQEAFGKLVQHLTVQSRAYRIYVVGQVLDNYQNPRGTAVIEAGIYLQYSPTDGRLEPVIQYMHFLK
jgi:hypothetical protein